MQITNYRAIRMQKKNVLQFHLPLTADQGSNRYCTRPKMICNGNAVLPHFQMPVTIMGFAEHLR